MAIERGNSPFYPNQPVPPDSFLGRKNELERIEQWAIKPVASGRMSTVFLQGEYGIGKTSLAKAAQQVGEERHGLHPIYCSLGGAKNLADVAEAIVHSTVRSRAREQSRAERLTEAFAGYVEEVNLFGAVKLKTAALKPVTPALEHAFGLLDFLAGIRKLLDAPGVFLVLDEINGIASVAEFAHYLKSLVDSNGGSPNPIPFLLMMCGTAERRSELIRSHRPVERIFEIVPVDPMVLEDAQQFFQITFESAGMDCDSETALLFAQYSAGFPRMMQIIGDAAYRTARGATVGGIDAIVAAAEEIGTRYVDTQVYDVLKSADYVSILDKIARTDPSDLRFRKSDVEAGLTITERRKLNNFLQKMKKLNVLRLGDQPGDWVFRERMVRFYMWLRSQGLAAEARRPRRGRGP